MLCVQPEGVESSLLISTLILLHQDSTLISSFNLNQFLRCSLFKYSHIRGQNFNERIWQGNFPSNPVVKNPYLQRREHRFHPWLGNWDPTLAHNSPNKNTGVGCHALLQGIFPTQDPTSKHAMFFQLLRYWFHLAMFCDIQYVSCIVYYNYPIVFHGFNLIISGIGFFFFNFMSNSSLIV